jgi:hypothetical protein
MTARTTGGWNAAPANTAGRLRTTPRRWDDDEPAAVPRPPIERWRPDLRERIEDFSRSGNLLAAYQLLRRRGHPPAEFAQSGLIAPKVVDAPMRRRTLRDSTQCESAAAALGVETPASLEVAVNELGVLAYRAEDSKCVGRAERHGLLRRVRLHRSERRASGGPKHRPNVYPCLPQTFNRTG